ncbi:phosphatase [Vibrio mangrovi]|uniref:Phosphatase n=1 Tax=Vibrio mangrovi TaxID=474394 RepID=A0A1Y6J2W3_9VIBR|nr:phosphatase [Vibrio mangrovi]MDW6005340.1 phosphatase [Vibrio mangrovi]SMS03052.1 putative phosphatase YcdX [Vibrio mangrovi]
MNIVVDTHTHTYASGHAYSTLLENVSIAKTNGLEILCTTDHAERMPGAPHPWFFANQKVIPRFLEGVAIIRGVEANILTVQGEIDVQPHVLSQLDWVIGSFHEPVFVPADKRTHTQALINVIERGEVDALGHLGNPRFDFDFEPVIQCAAENHVAIEINNSTLLGHSRVGSIERCYEIGRIAKLYGAPITTGSDAHFCHAVGELSLVRELLETLEIPTEQVITHSSRQFLQFLELRGHKAIADFSSM